MDGALWVLSVNAPMGAFPLPLLAGDGPLHPARRRSKSHEWLRLVSGCVCPGSCPSSGFPVQTCLYALFRSGLHAASLVRHTSTCGSSGSQLQITPVKNEAEVNYRV